MCEQLNLLNSVRFSYSGSCNASDLSRPLTVLCTIKPAERFCSPRKRRRPVIRALAHAHATDAATEPRGAAGVNGLCQEVSCDKPLPRSGVGRVIGGRVEIHITKYPCKINILQ